jgi:hypothetical protein
MLRLLTGAAPSSWDTRAVSATHNGEAIVATDEFVNGLVEVLNHHRNLGRAHAQIGGLFRPAVYNELSALSAEVRRDLIQGARTRTDNEFAAEGTGLP